MVFFPNVLNSESSVVTAIYTPLQSCILWYINTMQYNNTMSFISNAKHNLHYNNDCCPWLIYDYDYKEDAQKNNIIMVRAIVKVK